MQVNSSEPVVKYTFAGATTGKKMDKTNQGFIPERVSHEGVFYRRRYWVACGSYIPDP
jgi:hypothetical protein